MSCECIKLDLTVEKYRLTYVSEIYGNGVLFLIPQGKKNQTLWFKFTLNSNDFVIWYDNLNDKWVVQSGSLPDSGGTIHLHWLNVPLPQIQSGGIAPNQWINLTGVFSIGFETFYSVNETFSFDLTPTGIFNTYNYYEFQINGVLCYLYFNGATQWEIGWVLGGAGGQSFGAVKNSPPPCPPIAGPSVWITGEGFNSIETKECDTFLINCLTICYSLGYDQTPECFDVNIYDVNNEGAPIFIFEIPEYPNQQFAIAFFTIGSPPFGPGWYLYTLGPAGDIIAYLDNDGTFVNFPQAAPNVYGWTQNTYFNIFDTTLAKECPIIPSDCDCGIKFTFDNGGEISFSEVTLEGLHNGRNYWSLTFENQNVFVYWNGFQWDLAPTLDAPNSSVIARLFKNSLCPIGDPAPPEPLSFLNLWVAIGDQYQDFLTLKSEGISCVQCGREDRIFRKYDAIQLPVNFSEPNRGLKECCCENLVLASSSSNTWENDLTSAWIKLNIGGTATFKLLTNGVETNYTPTPQLFVNEPNAIYTTVNWNDVLNSDGPGCYELIIEYNIGGIVGNLVWGKYKLLPFTIENARKTARVRAIFNGFQEIEGINFTGSNVESSHRFYGFIGNRQPNTEIDNLIYSDRQMKRVLRENLNQYEILTDPINECELLPLIDLYLLSENELFISDYNAHNFTYRITDLPVIVEESAEIEYYEFSRKASLKCIVGDKFKNKRTYFDK